jgi:hypothetical protein
MLENCQAIKCPSIDYHLTTFKKFQQAFCKQEVLKDILAKVNPTPAVESSLLKVF